MIAAVPVVPVFAVAGGDRAGAHEEHEEQSINELPGHWGLLGRIGPDRTRTSSYMSIEVHRDFFAVALSRPVADLTLTYWFVHCDEAAVWTTYNDFDVRCRVRKDTSILGGDVMTIRKPVVSQAALVLASMASTAAFGQTAPGASDEAVGGR